MGDMVEFRCDSCSKKERVYFGCGFAGCLTPFYCSKCGRIDERFETFGPADGSGMLLKHEARCRRHPWTAMIEVTMETDVPCSSCSDGVRRHFDGGIVGLWD